MKLLKNISKIIILAGIIFILGTMENSDLCNYSAIESLRGVSKGAMLLVLGSFLNSLSKVKIVRRKERKIRVVKGEFSGGCLEYKKAV